MHFQYHRRENWQLIIFCANIQLNSLVCHVCKHRLPEIHEVNLKNIEDKTCNNILESVNKLALSVRMGHSCVKFGEINTIPLIILNKTQKFYHRVKCYLYYMYLQVYDKKIFIKMHMSLCNLVTIMWNYFPITVKPAHSLWLHLISQDNQVY